MNKLRPGSGFQVQKLFPIKSGKHRTRFSLPPPDAGGEDSERSSDLQINRRALKSSATLSWMIRPQTPLLRQQSTMEASSPYAHVFQPGEPGTPWDKLSASDPSPPSMLHAKFWAKSIDEDRSEWEKEQGGEPTEIEGSDVGPGCFLLDLGIESFAFSRLWVRKDYIRLYDVCNTYFNEIINLHVPPPSVVITGQPGIGACSPP